MPEPPPVTATHSPAIDPLMGWIRVRCTNSAQQAEKSQDGDARMAAIPTRRTPLDDLRDRPTPLTMR